MSLPPPPNRVPLIEREEPLIAIGEVPPKMGKPQIAIGEVLPTKEEFSLK